MYNIDIIERIASKYQEFLPYLNERTRRVWSGIEARALGHGGIAAVSKATGLNRSTIRAGIKEVEASKGQPDELTGIRKSGGGRKQIETVDETLVEELNALVEPTTRGDPESPLRWTCKSVVKLAKELQNKGHQVCAKTIYNLLQKMGYSLQSNRKTEEGKDNPDRDRQFHYITNKVTQFQKKHYPVISVDTKKKELVGNFKNNGEEWEPSKQPVAVNVHDFKDEELGKAIPYGVYDLSSNQGWVSVGVTHDTAEFAVETIRHWWEEMGKPVYPKSKHLLITADCGGSNGYRTKLWKLKLQELADLTGLTIDVCHFPPGTSKWNKIEHQMFSHITQNWRGRPLTSLEVIVNLIANTSTQKGLKIRAILDEAIYDTGIKVSDAELNSISLHKRRFHGDWNYQISPNLLP